jgi:hypothetical protein
MRMKIGIISTMYGAPWGGSEELWAATALEARNAGHEAAKRAFRMKTENGRRLHVVCSKSYRND